MGDLSTEMGWRHDELIGKYQSWTDAPLQYVELVDADAVARLTATSPATTPYFDAIGSAAPPPIASSASRYVPSSGRSLYANYSRASNTHYVRRADISGAQSSGIVAATAPTEADAWWHANMSLPAVSVRMCALNAIAQACLRWNPAQRPRIEFVALILECLSSAEPRVLASIDVHSTTELIVLCQLRMMRIGVAHWWRRAPDAALVCDAAQRDALERMLPWFREAAEASEARSDEQDVGARVSRVALMLEAQGKHVEALEMHARVLAIREAVCGAQHADVAASLDTMAGVMQVQGDFDAAAPVLQRALAIRAALLGAEHEDVAASLDRVAHNMRGDLKKAKPLFERAHAIRVALQPAKPLDVATSQDNLASIAMLEGDMPGARALYESALRVREDTLGPQHPAVASSLEGLARVLHYQCELREAAALCDRALQIREASLGVEHPSVATTLSLAALLLELQVCDSDEARAEANDAALGMYERALRIREAALGARHPLIAESRRAAEWLARKMRR